MSFSKEILFGHSLQFDEWVIYWLLEKSVKMKKLSFLENYWSVLSTNFIWQGLKIDLVFDKSSFCLIKTEINECEYSYK